MAVLSDVIGRGLASAKPGSPAEGYLYFSTDTGALERYSGSAWEVIGGGALSWKFSTTTAAADPGAGVMRFDNATPASVTTLYVDDLLLNSGCDMGAALGVLAAGSRIYIEQAGDSSKYLLGAVVSVTDSTGYWTIVVTVDDSGTLPDDGAALTVTLVPQGGGGGGALAALPSAIFQGVGAMGMMSPAHRYGMRGNTQQALGCMNALSYAGFTDGYWSQGYWTNKDECLRRGFNQTMLYATNTTANYHAYVSPQNAYKCYVGGGMIWAVDFIWGTNAGLGTNRSFCMALDGLLLSGSNANALIAGTYYGATSATYMNGIAAIVQTYGGTAYFITGDGTAQESTTLTGVDLFDGHWHDTAIIEDPENPGEWYAYVDGTVFGPHSTYVPTQGASYAHGNAMVPTGPGLVNAATGPSAGNTYISTSYNTMLMAPPETAELIAAVGAL